MSKDFTVLSECVDRRTGKRYKAGQVFDPPPSVDQAIRLSQAKCLPSTAVKAAGTAAAAKARQAAGLEHPADEKSPEEAAADLAAADAAKRRKAASDLAGKAPGLKPEDLFVEAAKILGEDSTPSEPVKIVDALNKFAEG